MRKLANITLYCLFFTIPCFGNTQTIELAKATVAKADSLHHEKKLFSDTAQLKSAISALKPLKIIYPKELSNAYYYLGRNLDRADYDARSVEYFIQCLSLPTNNYELHLRALNNLIALCHHQHEDSLALIIATQAEQLIIKQNYIETKKDFYIYHLTNLINIKLSLGQFENASKDIERLNSIQTISKRELGQKYETLATYHYMLGQTDSALYYIDKSLEYPTIYNTHNNIYRKFMIGKIHFANHNYDSALHYISQVLDTVSLKNNHIEAIDYIFKIYDLTYNETAIDYLKRMDVKLYEDAKSNDEEEKRAIDILKSHYYKKELKRKHIYLAIIIIIMVTIVLVLILHNKSQSNSSITKMIEKNITDYNNIDITSTLYWNDSNSLMQHIDKDFYNLWHKLLQYNLSDKEIRFCILVLLNYSMKDISKHLFLSYNSIGKTKSRIATKLNTTSPKLHDFLVALIVK